MTAPTRTTQDFVRFAVLTFREWQALVTGGALIAGLFVVERVAKRTVSPTVPQAIAALALLVAVFRVWRREREGRLVAEQRLRETEVATAAIDDLVPQTTDEEFWLICAAKKNGLRRQFHMDRHGASSNSFWLGTTPIDYVDSRWFYDLATGVIQRGLLELGRGDVYRLSSDAERIVEVGLKRGRKIEPPKTALVDARSGKVIPGT